MIRKSWYELERKTEAVTYPVSPLSPSSIAIGFPSPPLGHLPGACSQHWGHPQPAAPEANKLLPLEKASVLP